MCRSPYDAVWERKILSWSEMVHIHRGGVERVTGPSVETVARCIGRDAGCIGVSLHLRWEASAFRRVSVRFRWWDEVMWWSRRCRGQCFGGRASRHTAAGTLLLFVLCHTLVLLATSLEVNNTPRRFPGCQWDVHEGRNSCDVRRVVATIGLFRIRSWCQKWCRGLNDRVLLAIVGRVVNCQSMWFNCQIMWLNCQSMLLNCQSMWFNCQCGSKMDK